MTNYNDRMWNNKRIKMNIVMGDMNARGRKRFNVELFNDTNTVKTFYLVLSTQYQVLQDMIDEDVGCTL